MSLYRNARLLAAVVFSFVLFSFPASALEAVEGGKKEGLPQFDPAWFPEQMFWLVISFAILYLCMAFVALPRVSKTQGNRKRVIASEIEQARAANNDAKASVAAVEKSLSEARAKAQARVGEMLAEVTEEANDHRAAQEKELSRKLHTAEEDIAVTRAKAMDAVRASASDIAAAVVEKVLGFKGRAKA
jgi:F-type H+-transporting ATPase subunit b